MDQAALGEGHAAENRDRMKQQHGRRSCKARGGGLMRGGGGKDHAVGAHHACQRNQDAIYPRHQRLSSISRTMAARNSGMPLPERDEVASTSGKAAGCLASAAAVSARRLSRSPAFTWSALVSTI